MRLMGTPTQRQRVSRLALASISTHVSPREPIPSRGGSPRVHPYVHPTPSGLEGLTEITCNTIVPMHVPMPSNRVWLELSLAGMRSAIYSCLVHNAIWGNVRIRGGMLLESGPDREPVSSCTAYSARQLTADGPSYRHGISSRVWRLRIDFALGDVGPQTLTFE